MALSSDLIERMEDSSPILHLLSLDT